MSQDKPPSPRRGSRSGKLEEGSWKIEERENIKKRKMKKILITGGTGSFGNAVLNGFLHTDYFKEIRIFSRDERKQDDL